MREQKIDEMMWYNGLYTKSAFEVVVSHFGAGLAGKKSRAEYIKEPILSKVISESDLTEEQRYERELRKALAAEEQWIAVGRMKGLPETVIN